MGYMDYCDDLPICRKQQLMIRLRDKSNNTRCCCQFNKTIPIDPSLPSLWAPDCVYSSDGTVKRWSVIRAGDDLVCHPGMKMTFNMIEENLVQINMSCCDKDIITTTTSTTTTMTTTLEPNVTITTTTRKSLKQAF